MRILLSVLLSVIASSTLQIGAQKCVERKPQVSEQPHLEFHGNMQMFVCGKPYLMLAGELHNSSSSSLEYMKPIWPRLAAMHLNTVLTPVSWELMEPEEGHYDFALVDGLLAQAREQNMHMVLLWLAAWKNGMSGYPPAWVKRDTTRFPRVVLNGVEGNILSTFAPATREADARAFAALMRHIKEADSADHTVLMVQVENEVGVLGAARDHSQAADRAFAGAVPNELMKYLNLNKNNLDPEFRTLWEENGSRLQGTWSQVFGPSDRADELFMAWNYATYVHAVAAKGKVENPLPLFVNTWLGGGTSKPGDYPSGGPQPRVLDIWKAARTSQPGSSLDMYTPDLYASDFAGWSGKYHRDGNPLFLPETNGGEAGAENIFYAFGEHAALGFSPFAIDSMAERDKTGTDKLVASYATLAEIGPTLLTVQGKGPDMHGNMRSHGFVLDKTHPSVDFRMDDVVVHVSLDEIFGNHAERGFGLLLETGPGEFLGAGEGFRVTFSRVATDDKNVGIASIDEGRFVDEAWVAGRRLNGDENDQGNVWRFDQSSLHIEKARLYRYE